MLLPTLLALIGTPPSPIIIRHDRPDRRYLELGARYPAVGRVGRRMGDGTLVGDRWVLTAAHVAAGLMRRGGEPAVWFGDRAYPVRRAYLHPEWAELNPHDIALLELQEPVAGIAPLPLYRGSGEAGQVMTLVGHGQTGLGNARERHDDDQKRGATNQVEEATAAQLVFRFDAPPGGTDLEGTPGAGDSGGPALLSEAGRDWVAGVSSAGQPGDQGPGSYGALDFFTRVSTHLRWVDEVLGGRVAATDVRGPAMAAGRPGTGAVVVVGPGGSGDAALPDSPAGQRMGALLALIRGEDATRVEPFIREHVGVAPGGPVSAAQVAAYQRLLERYRGAQVVQVLLAEPHHVDLLVRTAAGQFILGVEVEPVSPHRIRGVLEGRM